MIQEDGPHLSLAPELNTLTHSLEYTCLSEKHGCAYSFCYPRCVSFSFSLSGLEKGMQDGNECINKKWVNVLVSVFVTIMKSLRQATL